MGSAPTWSELAFALPLAMLAYTGLETVANYASETREPGKALPRGLFAGLGTVVVVSALLAVIGLSAYPVENGCDRARRRVDAGRRWWASPSRSTPACRAGSWTSSA